MNPLSIVALQLDLIWEDPAANRQHIEALLDKAKVKADLILLPELFTTGFTMNVERLYEEVEGETQAWMQGIAQQYDAMVGGSLIVKEQNLYHNRFILTVADGIVAEYDKRHLFFKANEPDYFMEGNEFVRVEYKGWKIAPMVCYDLRFPVWSRNRKDETGELGVDLLVYVANWPTPRIRHWDILLQARAIENQCFVAGVNRVGTDGNAVPYNGSSAIVDPKGNVLAHHMDEEKVLQATLDGDLLRSYRQKFPVWKDADDFDVFP